MDRAWLKGHGQKKGNKSAAAEGSMQHQAVGEYCKGDKLEECRKNFGAALARICATCPN